MTVQAGLYKLVCFGPGRKPKLLVLSRNDSISIYLFQKACYLSINPLKEESMETEKAQYMLPDGSTIEVRRYSAVNL